MSFKYDSKLSELIYFTVIFISARKFESSLDTCSDFSKTRCKLAAVLKSDSFKILQL